MLFLLEAHTKFLRLLLLELNLKEGVVITLVDGLDSPV